MVDFHFEWIPPHQGMNGLKWFNPGTSEPITVDDEEVGKMILDEKTFSIVQYQISNSFIGHFVSGTTVKVSASTF